MTKPVDHGARDHATWSASSTARNWLCLGAIALNTRITTPEKESEASAWGTACHQLSEKCFAAGRDADEFIGTTERTKQRSVEVDEEMAETAQVYVDYVRGRVAEYNAEFPEGPAPIVVHEQYFSLNDLKTPFDAGGTGDTVIHFPRWRSLEVVDLKGGRGVVEAADNKQLRTYGLGAVLANPGRDVEDIKVTIVQPRAPHKDGRVRSETFHIGDLIDWTTELLQRMALSKQAQDEISELPFAAWTAKWLTPGSCKFCRSEGSCPALEQRALDAAQVWFDDLDRPQISNSPTNDTPEALSKTLDLLDMIQDWINARRAFAHQQSEAGVDIPNYVRVPKVGREKFIDDEAEAKARSVCRDAGLPESKYLNPAKTKTPKQIRKALGKAKKSLLAGLSVTPSEGSDLVRADKTTREAIRPAADRFFEELKD
ncbi:DUF2800 domain-containing protein [Rhodopseudomonas pseudopalustris]|uniref:PD-(D/E)XK nuclease superfamily protein n=1 Tax=Rhodopseudomonas pseudopalustris TaxID=1513892 RepID=A0A1H8WH11_9BRAD|nr:DUF2800 domain-containing protein [Rhodopseudomonas pseudopalustris]SEP26931.1 Protein of unknown function [Rhodopseudomonas pseudopalustris]